MLGTELLWCVFHLFDSCCHPERDERAELGGASFSLELHWAEEHRTRARRR